MLSFRQVDVFSSEPLLGNPVAVVHDADGMDADQMARFARWTNLSETTFLGRVHVTAENRSVWVGGETRTVLVGEAAF